MTRPKGEALLSEYAKQSGEEASQHKFSKLFKQRSLEDGRTSLRSVRQYKSLKEIYEAFNEPFPRSQEEAKKNFQQRVENFRVFLEQYEERLK